MGTKDIINAIKENNPIKLQEALDFFKECINEDYGLNQVVGKNGQRLLHIATKYGSETALLYLLLEPEINVNITDDQGNTPAHYAVIYEQPTILELLKDNKADFSKKNNYGCTLEHYLSNKPKKEKNKRIRKKFENILMNTSALTMLADVAVEQAVHLKRKRTEQEEIHPNKIHATKSFFFHNLPRELECQSQPLDLTQNKAWNLSIPPCF